jgi:hypothetical protein
MVTLFRSVWEFSVSEVAKGGQGARGRTEDRMGMVNATKLAIEMLTWGAIAIMRSDSGKSHCIHLGYVCMYVCMYGFMVRCRQPGDACETISKHA